MPKLIYFEIAVASPNTKRQAIYTYSFDSRLVTGQIVVVPLKNTRVMGVVLSTVEKPSYTARNIYEAFGAVLPARVVSTLRWMLNFYPLDQGMVVRLFCPPLPQKRKKPGVTIAASNIVPSDLTFAPTKEQHDALAVIKQAKGPLLLFGVTGSGKTKVYEEAALHTLAEGKSVLFLAPEISLGQHLKTSFEQRISNIITTHSLLTPAQRRDIWYGLAASKQSHFVIGPRSALFLPLTNLGLIILDEAHDQSYKQQQTPYYSSLQVASQLAHEWHIPLIYGSATPNVNDYYSAILKSLPIVRMTERPVQQKTKAPRAIFSVYSSRETDLFKRSAFIARPILDAIQASTSRQKQSLLLLNRRGTAQLMRCEDCGWQMDCADCERAIVYHKDLHQGMCHVCGRNYPVPAVCPDCNGSIRMYIIGTKFIEEHLRSIFPQYSVLRVDSDSIDRREVQQTLEMIKNGDVSIIIGTQLLAKGLDLPNLENIVILDAARQSSDYLSDERYYQLLHQVIGRGMRGHQATHIHIQSLQPEDQIIAWATEENWQAFYEKELTDRQRFNYPPFTYLASATFEKVSSEIADRVVRQFEVKLRHHNLHVQLLGPIREYRTPGKKPVWRVLLKSPSRQRLVQAGQLAPSDWRIDFEPMNV